MFIFQNNMILTYTVRVADIANHLLNSTIQKIKGSDNFFGWREDTNNVVLRIVPRYILIPII